MNDHGHLTLSVIVPTKNRPHLLQKALASVALQNFTSFELCVVDNNTNAAISEQVKAMVTTFEQQYPLISWIYIHSTQKFASGARNDGMNATKGNYIVFLDDDDELLNDSLIIRMKEMANDPLLALLYCAGYSRIYPYPFKMYRYYHYNKQLHKTQLMMMSCSSIMINRDIFKENNLYFDNDQSRMDDYDLCRNVIELGLKVKSIPQPLVLINLHPETRISSHHLVSYDFKDVLIKKWGASAADMVYNYAEGVYVWRKCFGTSKMAYSEIIKILKTEFNRKPSLSFRLKYMLVTVSPQLFLGLYHIAIILSQYYKNKLVRQSDRVSVNQ
ncbi:glycosyltransferase family 2 protein [Pedobacter sp. L105]|uniref:glycosyltransferase family 2 protein n=1 Tax=Pedobacter sp. L105 TaxID=1641871 RepID=UPI00131B9CF0|nr:glycosyltransferase family 2 protein [Pedobacter sp. L105]